MDRPQHTLTGTMESPTTPAEESFAYKCFFWEDGMIESVPLIIITFVKLKVGDTTVVCFVLFKFSTCVQCKPWFLYILRFNEKRLSEIWLGWSWRRRADFIHVFHFGERATSDKKKSHSDPLSLPFPLPLEQMRRKVASNESRTPSFLLGSLCSVRLSIKYFLHNL